jgi:hypothetical protein
MIDADAQTDYIERREAALHEWDAADWWSLYSGDADEDSPFDPALMWEYERDGSFPVHEWDRDALYVRVRLQLADRRSGDHREWWWWCPADQFPTRGYLYALPYVRLAVRTRRRRALIAEARLVRLLALLDKEDTDA